MFISEDYFIYDGQPSYPFGLRFAWVERSPDTTMTSSKSYNYIKNKAFNTFDISRVNYEEALQLDVEIISNRVLDDSEVRQVYKLFFEKNQFKELSFPSKKGEKITFNCIFTNVERFEGGMNNSYGVVGFKAKLICDAPWGWTDEKIIEPELVYENAGGDLNIHGAKFSIFNHSDCQDYIYPTIEFTVCAAAFCSNGTRPESQKSCLACGALDVCRTMPNKPVSAMLINETDSETRVVCVLADTYEQDIVMNPQRGEIIKNGADSKSVISSTNKKFLRLLPGENILYVENVKDLVIKFKEARILV